MSHWGLHKGGGGGAMSGSSADRLLVRRLVRLGECGVDVLPHGRHIVRQRRDAGGRFGGEWWCVGVPRPRVGWQLCWELWREKVYLA